MTLDFERDGVVVSAVVVGTDILQKLADEFEQEGVRVGARPFALSPTIRELVEPEGLLTRHAPPWPPERQRGAGSR